MDKREALKALDKVNSRKNKKINGDTGAMYVAFNGLKSKHKIIDFISFTGVPSISNKSVLYNDPYIMQHGDDYAVCVRIVHNKPESM